MAYKEFEELHDAYMQTNWTFTPIKDFVNNPEKVKGFDAWIGYEPEFVDDEVNSIGDGPHCILQDIIMVYSIFVPSASGKTVAIDLSDKLKKLFIGKQLTSNITFHDVVGPDFGGDKKNQSSGKWFKTEITVYIEHRYFM